MEGSGKNKSKKKPSKSNRKKKRKKKPSKSNREEWEKKGRLFSIYRMNSFFIGGESPPTERMRKCGEFFHWWRIPSLGKCTFDNGGHEGKEEKRKSDYVTK